MSDVQTQFALMATPVREFFCPELSGGALSFTSPLAYRTQKLCHAAGIQTLNTLVEKSDKELRLKSFDHQVVTFIHEKLGEVGLRLSPDYPSAVPAHLDYLKQMIAK